MRAVGGDAERAGQLGLAVDANVEGVVDADAIFGRADLANGDRSRAAACCSRGRKQPQHDETNGAMTRDRTSLIMNGAA